MPGRPWKTTEVLSVIRQVGERKKLPEIKIEGKTRHAINAVLVKLRRSGRLKDRPTRATRAYSISQQMRRLGLGDPKVRALAKKAKRLPKEKAKSLEVLLRGSGKKIATKRIAKAWGVRPAAVTDRRRKLNVKQSWHEARRESPRFARMNSA